MKSVSARIRSRQRGMTLLELVVVIVLVGGLLAVLGNRILGSKSRAEYKLAQTQMAGLSQKLEQYRVDVGRYPARLSDLQSPPEEAEDWLGPYAREAEFRDPWGVVLTYAADDAGSRYTLTSHAADRAPGGVGIDKDIVVTP